MQVLILKAVNMEINRYIYVANNFDTLGYCCNYCCDNEYYCDDIIKALH